jgi:hypothetical protein
MLSSTSMSIVILDFFSQPFQPFGKTFRIAKLEELEFRKSTKDIMKNHGFRYSGSEIDFLFISSLILIFQIFNSMLLLCKKASLFLKRHDQYSFIKYRVHSNL